MGRNRLGLGLALVATAMTVGAATAQAENVRIRSTTDIVDSNLAKDIIIPMYQAATGDTLALSSEGTGAAIASAQQGLGDGLVTHAPASEAQFIAQGYSLEPIGRQIFYSDYVIVGPNNDPANVAQLAPHDAITAFELIAKAGENGTATYVTRNDTSGTNVQEQLMWGQTSTVTKQTPINYTAPATPPAGTAEPGSGGTTPNWYEPAGVGKVGQATGLNFANKCAVSANFPNGGCYTMADRGTYNALVNQGLLPNLKIVSQHNDASARGGLNLLLNPFSVYVVNPDKFPAGTVNPAAGTRFADFMTSYAFQATLATYPTAADPAFFADAQPSVTGAPPTTAAAGSTVPLALTLADKLPPQLAIQGIPVQLEASTDGTHFSPVGDPVMTAANGSVSFSPTVTATTTFRVSTPRFTKFSPSSTVLGVVAVPGATPVVKPVDKTAPSVKKAALTGRTLTLTVDEAGTYKVVIAKKTTKTTKVKGKKKTKTTYVKTKSFSVSSTGVGVVRTKFNNLKPATYRITISTSDAAGNKKTQTVSLVLKAKKSVSKTLG